MERTHGVCGESQTLPRTVLEIRVQAGTCRDVIAEVFVERSWALIEKQHVIQPWRQWDGASSIQPVNTDTGLQSGGFPAWQVGSIDQAGPTGIVRGSPQDGEFATSKNTPRFPGRIPQIEGEGGMCLFTELQFCLRLVLGEVVWWMLVLSSGVD